uniref:Uncharacterized protein n=1 Tax=Glaucocystis sp. BBH TaxID=2023628 RepID=A0A3G1IV53_9EUKA|nr:hypothetical protein [Glaucocystis sp. BBH]
MKQLEYQVLAQQIYYWSEKTKSVVQERKSNRLRFDAEMKFNQEKHENDERRKEEEHQAKMLEHQATLQLIQAQIDSFRNY